MADAQPAAVTLTVTPDWLAQPEPLDAREVAHWQDFAAAAGPRDGKR